MEKKEKIEISKAPEIINKMWRTSLLEMGYGSSSHVYEINIDDLPEGNPQANIIKIARKLYDSLGELERKILTAEVLERGQYYGYWYLPYANSKAYSRKKKTVITLAVRVFL